MSRSLSDVCRGSHVSDWLKFVCFVCFLGISLSLDSDWSNVTSCFKNSECYLGTSKTLFRHVSKNQQQQYWVVVLILSDLSLIQPSWVKAATFHILRLHLVESWRNVSWKVLLKLFEFPKYLGASFAPKKCWIVRRDNQSLHKASPPPIQSARSRH